MVGDVVGEDVDDGVSGGVVTTELLVVAAVVVGEA